MVSREPPPPAWTDPNPVADQANAESTADNLPLPAFVTREAGAVMIDMALLEDPERLKRFVDRAFAADTYFADLDYATFERLLYPFLAGEPVAAGRPPGKLRLAAAIADFAPRRRELYQLAKAADHGTRIEYVFSPVRLEDIVEVPIYGETDAAGQPVQTGTEKQVRQVPTTLSADEFVAVMWRQGIRGGIDIDAVKAAIASGKDSRIDVARQIDPKAGTDATVEEQTEALHRNDTPSILPSGKVDLRHFKNHFPQVKAGTCLVKKLPRRLGTPGLATDGTVLEPEIPRDFDLEELAGEGTQVERTAKGEFVHAMADGFLAIDTDSHKISITAKIVNQGGVSLRTTGNLTLGGDHYEEHGEVHEGGVVEGKHMDFFADVFGTIVSAGGEVHLHANLSGGGIRNPGGQVCIDGRISRAIIEVRDGGIQANQAEGSTLVAGKLCLARAIACDIVAEEVEIEEALGCTIAARRIKLGRAGARRSEETLLAVCVPDFAVLEKRRTELQVQVDAIRQRLATAGVALDARTDAAEVRPLLALEQRIRGGTLKLTPDQAEKFRQAMRKLAAPLAEIMELRKAIEVLHNSLGETMQQLADLETSRERACADISCAVAAVVGETTVQSIGVDPTTSVFAATGTNDVKLRLRDTRLVRERLFTGSSGNFAWSLTPPAGESDDIDGA